MTMSLISTLDSFQTQCTFIQMLVCIGIKVHNKVLAGIHAHQSTAGKEKNKNGRNGNTSSKLRKLFPALGVLG